MTARLLDGVALSGRLRTGLADRARRFAAGGRPPGLAVILVGDDPASAVYVRNKVKACEQAGIRSTLERGPATMPEAVLLAVIERLNADPTVDGILVQMPLPPQIDPARIVETIVIGRLSAARIGDASATCRSNAAGVGMPDGR